MLTTVHGATPPELVVVQPAGRVPGGVESNDSASPETMLPSVMLNGTTPRLLGPS